MPSICDREGSAQSCGCSGGSSTVLVVGIFRRRIAFIEAYIIAPFPPEVIRNVRVSRIDPIVEYAQSHSLTLETCRTGLAYQTGIWDLHAYPSAILLLR